MRRMLGLLVGGVFAGSLAAQAVWPDGQPRLPVPGQTPPAVHAPAVQENLRSFDPQQVRLVWAGRRWQLVHNGEPIKDFGAREQEARQALRLIQELGLNQVGWIGTPHPVMEYWLAGGKAPQAPLLTALRSVQIVPARLRVEQVQGQWCVREGPRTLFNFGPHAQDAQQALAVIRAHNFEQVAVIGQVNPSMYVFLARPQGNANAPGRLPANTQVGRQFTPAAFSRRARNPDGSPRTEKTAGPGANGLDGVLNPLLPGPRTPAVQTAGATRWHAQPHVGYQGEVVSGERVVFDWRQVQLRQHDGEWKLMAGGTVLANFGANVQVARLGLQAVRHYRFTEQLKVGGDRPYFTYFVSPPTAPRALMLGMHAEPFQPDKIEVKRLDAGYAVTQGQRVIVRLRDHEGDAKKLLDTIKRGRCTHVCRLGEPGKEAMTLLVRSR